MLQLPCIDMFRARKRWRRQVGSSFSASHWLLSVSLVQLNIRKGRTAKGYPPALCGVNVKIPCFEGAECGDIEGKREANHTAHFRGTALKAREFRGSGYGCRQDLASSMINFEAAHFLLPLVVPSCRALISWEGNRAGYGILGTSSPKLSPVLPRRHLLSPAYTGSFHPPSAGESGEDWYNRGVGVCFRSQRARTVKAATGSSQSQRHVGSVDTSRFSLFVVPSEWMPSASCINTASSYLRCYTLRAVSSISHT
ncbi:hypothetical protein EDD85DRAFT_342422 [Armillaria nabsnona]|nr:hypothetical protein EDD85DRAFT_342422 [Armillaria nabsnona]